MAKASKSKHRWIRARCKPTPFDDYARDLADDFLFIELTVLGPQSGFPDGGRWRLRTETPHGAWETPISVATAKALIDESGWNVPPLSES